MNSITLVLVLRLFSPWAEAVQHRMAALEARASTAPLEPLVFWDLSRTNSAAVLGEPHSKLRHDEEMPEHWFWKCDCRVIIRLPGGRVIDSPADSLTARVVSGRVVGISFLTSPRRFCADDVRAEMVWNITHLRARKGADDADAIRVLDRYLREATADRYVAAENFGSRSGPEPSVDIRLAGSDDEWGFTLVYDLYWPH